jgi:hypothetical protein
MKSLKEEKPVRLKIEKGLRDKIKKTTRTSAQADYIFENLGIIDCDVVDGVLKLQLNNTIDIGSENAYVGSRIIDEMFNYGRWTSADMTTKRYALTDKPRLTEDRPIYAIELVRSVSTAEEVDGQPIEMTAQVKSNPPKKSKKRTKRGKRKRKRNRKKTT